MKQLVQLWFEQSHYGIAFLKFIRRRNIISFQYQRVNDRFFQLLKQSIDISATGISISSLPFIEDNDVDALLQTIFHKRELFEKEYYQESGDRWITVTVTRISRQQLALLVSERSQETFSPVRHSVPTPSTIKGTNDLVESKQLLQVVVDASPVGLALLRPVYENGHIIDFRYLISNPKNALITGLSQQIMLENSLLSLFPNLLTNGIFAKLIEVVESGVKHNFELQDEINSGTRWGKFSFRRIEGDVLFTVQDITYLKKVEEELRQTNKVLEENISKQATELNQVNALQQAILTYAGIGITVTDPQGIIQFVNPALEILTGYQAEELIGRVTPRFLRDLTILDKQVDQLRPLIDDPSLPDDQTIMAYVSKYKFLQRENILQSKTGQKIPVYSSVSGLYDGHGTLLGYVDLTTDISRLKQFEETLLQEKYRTRLAIKAGKLGIWQWDLATDTLTLDDQFYTYFSLLEKNCLHHLNDILLLIHPDDVPLIKQAIQSIRDGADSVELKFRVNLPNIQTIHFIKINGLVYHSECGLARYVTGVAIDQTSIQQAEYALKQSEQRYRSLVDNLKEAVFQTDTRGCWTFLNQSWEEITGFSIDESLGTYFLDYILSEDHDLNKDTFESLIAGHKSFWQHEVRFIHKDEGYHWIKVFARVTVDENGQMTGVTGTLTDITDRKLAADALAETLKKEQSLNALKSQFISIASHQFRTPLTSIQSSNDLIQYLLESYDDSPQIKRVKKLTDQISQQILSLEELIFDTLTLSKLEDGQVKVNLEKTDINILIKDIISFSFGNRTDGREVQLFQSGEPAFVNVDPKLMRHVISNLLTNAFKFSSTNPQLAIHYTKKTLLITVSDQGIGVPAKDLPHLFTKFFRASNTGQITGTGLGLAICKEYILLQNGKIEVESEEGLGTTFAITLPIGQ